MTSPWPRRLLSGNRQQFALARTPLRRHLSNGSPPGRPKVTGGAGTAALSWTHPPEPKQPSASATRPGGTAHTSLLMPPGPHTMPSTWLALRKHRLTGPLKGHQAVTEEWVGVCSPLPRATASAWWGFCRVLRTPSSTRDCGSDDSKVMKCPEEATPWRQKSDEGLLTAVGEGTGGGVTAKGYGASFRSD